jgi:tetratricopeptide (TPR) repeat protein/nucleoside phosphorylase
LSRTIFRKLKHITLEEIKDNFFITAMDKISIDIIILDAKPEEHEVILELMESLSSHPLRPINAGPIVLHLAKIPDFYNKNHYSVATATIGDMGPEQSGPIASAIQSSINTNIIILAGIAMGLRHNEELELGDVVVSHQVISTVSRKLGPGKKLEFRHRSMDVSKPLVQRLATFKAHKDLHGKWISLIKPKRPKSPSLSGRKSKQLPEIFIGKCAAGGEVIKSDEPEVIESLKQEFPYKLYAYEMESGGILANLSYSWRQHQPDFIAVKSLSDWGMDETTDDDWREYARWSSAACALTLIRAGYLPLYMDHSLFDLSLQDRIFSEEFFELFSSRLTKFNSATIAPPKINDLFEILHDPHKIAPALFRMHPIQELKSYDTPYVAYRFGIKDSPMALYEALLESGGALLVQSRSGLGKTREITELAIQLCDREGWTVCVAKGEGDAHLNVPAAFPDEFRNKKILFVFDDLHQRIGAGAPEQKPYIERLNSFLQYFENRMAPGEIYIVATARSELHHQKQLGFDPSHPLWSRFRLYELQEFDLEALQSMLLNLTKWAKVDIDKAQVKEMVNKSDKNPRTLFLNIDRAKRHGEPLSLDNWLPSQGKSWDARLLEARGRWEAVEYVYQALHLIREAGLPSRFEYIVQLGSDLSHTDSSLAAEGLVDMGMIGLRNGLLDIFGDEQLRDIPQIGDKITPNLTSHWEVVIQAILTKVVTKPEWSGDLLNVVKRLLLSNRIKDAASAVKQAIERGLDNNHINLALVVLQVFQKNFVGAEADLTLAFERGWESEGHYILRGYLRALQQNHAGAEADFTAAIKLGNDHADTYLFRGVARYLQENSVEAEADFTAAIEWGLDNGDVYFKRGLTRLNQKNFAGAEADFTAAIERDQNHVRSYCGRSIIRIISNDLSEAEADITTAIKLKNGDKDLYIHRGQVRKLQRNIAGAEADFTAAIELGDDHYLTYFDRGVARYLQENSVEAEADFTAAIERGLDDGDVYFKRGLTRFNQKNFAGAEADFTAAIERGRGDFEIYIQRGFARISQNNFTEAEADFTVAVELKIDDDGLFFLRGELRNAQNNYAGAEADYTAAIKLGNDHADTYFGRGVARYNQGNYSEAEKDFIAAMERGRDEATVYQKKARALIRLKRTKNER